MKINKEYLVEFLEWVNDNYSQNREQGSFEMLPKSQMRLDFETTIYNVEEIVEIYIERNKIYDGNSSPKIEVDEYLKFIIEEEEKFGKGMESILTAINEEKDLEVKETYRSVLATQFDKLQTLKKMKMMYLEINNIK